MPRKRLYPAGLSPAFYSQWDWYLANRNKNNEHKGLAFYDRERMAQKLKPDSGMTLLAPTGELAAWIAEHCPDVDCTLDKAGFVKDAWHCGRFHGAFTVEAQRTDGAERVTDEYTLQRIEAKPDRDSRGNDVCFPWRVTFPDAVFHFRTLALAEAGIAELLKRRKAKHPKPDTLAARAASQVFFTDKRQRELPEDVYTEPAKAKRKRAPRKAACRRELATA